MEHRVCPWYMGYLLASPLRKIFQNPTTILSPYVKTGMNILEIGPGMGFFSLPMARLVGVGGKVYSIDLQERMLQSLRKRAAKNGIQNIVVARKCSESSLEVKDLNGTIDFALAFAVVHEIPDTQNLFHEIYDALRKGGTLLVSEPREHVSEKMLGGFISIAEKTGFAIAGSPIIRGGRSVMLRKP